MSRRSKVLPLRVAAPQQNSQHCMVLYILAGWALAQFPRESGSQMTRSPNPELAKSPADRSEPKIKTVKRGNYHADTS